MADLVKPAGGQVGETAKEVAGDTPQQAAGTMSDELRNLGREVAVEAIKVLSPVAKQAAERAAERAAQELVARAPGLVGEATEGEQGKQPEAASATRQSSGGQGEGSSF